MNQRTITMCSQKKLTKCAYCENSGTQLCDWQHASGGTCDESLCKIHSFTPKIGEDYCRLHRRLIEGAARDEKLKIEKEKAKRDTLIFIAHSKFPGRCKDKDCSASWDKGEAMFWDSRTRESYCEECGGSMQ